MLRLVARRARAQWTLLAALLAVVAIGSTLLGTCALLLTRTADQAVEVAAARAVAGDIDVTAYAVGVRGPDARSVVGETRGVLTSLLAPFAATTAARASSVMRSLPSAPAGGSDIPAQTYLSGVEDLSASVQLITGRWPLAGTDATLETAPLEAVVFESTARLLGLDLGGRIRLGAGLSDDPAPPVDVTIVGLVRPLPGTGWDRDPLAAAGYDPAYRGDFLQPVRVYGPLIVNLADLFASGLTIDRLEITAHPDLAAAARRDLDAVTVALRGADRELTRTVGERVESQRVASSLPRTLWAAHEQQRVTAATVLVVAVLGCVLAAAALALAGRLTAGVRAGETGLLTALGVGRGQLAVAATAEAGALAVLAAGIAIPASSALHAGLGHLPPMAGAGLAVRPGVTGVQVLAVAGGALAFAVVLLVLAVRPVPAVVDRGQRELLARSGADLLLVAFAVVGWWQLRAQPATAGSHIDAVRVLAPALLLTAGAALALRLLPPVLRGADRLARRARGLVLPLAAFEAARRPQAVAAGLLIALACAAGSFGLAYGATWERSQHDQADLSIGTDLALTLTSPPVAGQGTAVRAATGGEVSPAVDRGITIGQWFGGGADVPRMVAVDTARAGALLRGRLDGGADWAGVGAALAPPTRAAGVAVPVGTPLTLAGTATGATPLTVVPRLVLQDATGLRIPCSGAPVPLDGRTHRLPGCATTDGLRLVAVSLPIAADPAAPGSAEIGLTEDSGDSSAATDRSRVAVRLTVPGATISSGTASGSAWTATSAAPSPRQLSDPAIVLAGTAAGATLTMTTAVELRGPQDAARTLVATAFPDPGPVPVAVSTRFADELGARRGARLTVTVGTTPVPISVTRVLSTIPSAPGAVAVLADLDVLSRALIIGGDLEFPVDAWWAGRPTRPDAAERATGLRLGAVTTRAGEAARLTGGSLRASLPAALRLLVPAAMLLLFAGVVLHVTFDLRARALEVARLRGLGMSRRAVRAVLLGQHVGILLPLLVVGAFSGALTSGVVAPLLVRSDTGGAPVPAVQPQWPWAAEAALLALLLVGCVIAVIIVVSVQARRADAAHLRVTS